MQKYSVGQVAGAIYDNGPIGNPFLAAMPEELSKDEFFEYVRSYPQLPANLADMTSEERRQELPRLSTLFIPLDYMYVIYDLLYRAIRGTYMRRTSLMEIQNINALYGNREVGAYATQADTGSILGIPGIGKTSTVRRCLSILPQVIEHTEYQGHTCYCKQVLYLFVECPSDCSVKTLALNIMTALDGAIGSKYIESLSCLRTSSASALATQTKILCMTHHVGIILVDEIQNAVVTARKNRQVKPLIKFLVELTNDTSTGIYFVGTPLAEELFAEEEHLKRRTRGIRLLPFKPDGVYRQFLEQLWPYQLTPQQAALTNKLANKLYDWSGGIPAYIIKIFQESQVQALLHGEPAINEKTMQRAIDLLAIKVPKTYAGGTVLSDFEVELALNDQGTVLQGEVAEKEVPRLYANKRGRKAAQRDQEDLLAAFKEGRDILQHLTNMGLAERVEK